MMSHKFKEDFGFLQSEVDKLITKFGIGQEVREKIQQWHNGYSIPAGRVSSTGLQSLVSNKISLWN